jgi:hypothetical protein
MPLLRWVRVVVRSMCGFGMSALQQVYEQARRHGLSHAAALDAVAEGEVKCWCSNPEPCTGGAQRFVGCPVEFSESASIPLNFTHTRHRGDVA